MRTLSFPLLAVALLAAGPAHAQKLPVAVHRSSQSSDAAPVDGFAPPVLGYVIDAAGSVHRMPGLPGASWLSPPLHFGTRLATGTVSPRQDYILGLTAADRRALVLRFDGGTALLAGVDAGAGRLVLSPSGTAAAFAFDAPARLQIVTGLPDAPTVAGSVDLSPLAGAPGAIELSDDGTALLASVPSGDGAALFALSPQSAPRLLMNGGDFAALAFLRNSGDAIVADRLRNTLYRLRGAEIAPLAAAADGVSAPVSVAAAADGSRFFVVNAATATVGFVGAAGGPLTLLSCGCSPTTLAPLAGNAVFRLTEVSDDPLWLIDADALEPRLLLVPQSSERRSDR